MSQTPHPRVLLLVSTTSYRAGAFLDAARRLGVAAVVGSDRRQALADLHPEGHLTLDFGDPDRALAEILKSPAVQTIRAVVAADDDGTRIAAMAAQALGLRHATVAAVDATRTKLGMRQALSAAGLPGPAFRLVSIEDEPERLAEGVRYPCVIKPLHLSASRGVMRADDPVEFSAAFRRLSELLGRADVPDLWLPSASRSSLGMGTGWDPTWAKRRILIEDYLPGVEVAVEGLLTVGRLRVLAIFDKPDPLEGPLFEETLYVTPSRLDCAAQLAIVSCVTQAAAALGLGDGPVHAEARLHRGSATLVEIAPRSIGGLCSRTLRFTGGASLEELLLKHALGSDTDAHALEPGASGVMMVPIPAAGTLRAIGGLEEARSVPGVEDVRITIPIGREVVPLPEGSRYLGFIFARGAAPEGVEGALRDAHRRLSIEIEPGFETGPAEGLRYSRAAGTSAPLIGGTT